MNRAVKDSAVVSKFIGPKKVEGGSTFPYTKAQLRKVMSPTELTRFYRGARQAGINTRPIHGNYPGWGGFYPFKGRPGRIGMIAEELGVPATEADIQAELSKIRLAQSESTRNMRNAMEAATKGKLR